jgi:thioredoxin 1
MALVVGTDQNFATDVESAESGTVLVYYWAPWCPPCKVLGPMIEEIAGEIGNKVKIVKIDVDENPESTGKFEIMSIPTLMIFQNGELKSKVVGLKPKEQLIQWLESYM